MFFIKMIIANLIVVEVVHEGFHGTGEYHEAGADNQDGVDVVK